MLIYNCLNISDSRPTMECLCDLVPNLSKSLCITVNFLADYVGVLGMVVLIAISILHWWNPEKLISMYQYK